MKTPNKSLQWLMDLTGAHVLLVSTCKALTMQLCCCIPHLSSAKCLIPMEEGSLGSG